MRKGFITTVTVCTLTLSALTAPAIALADEYDDQIQQQNQKINDISNKEAAAQTQVNAVQTEINDIQAKAETLMKKQATLGTEIDNLNGEVKELNRRIKKRQGVIDKQARSMQIENNSTNYLTILVEADSLSDALNKVYSANKMVNANNDLVEKQESDRKAVQDKKAQTEANLEEVNKNAVVLEKQKGELVDRQYELEALQNQLAADKATEQSKKDEFIQKKEEAEAARKEQARLEAEAQEAARQAQAAQAAENNNQGNNNTQGTQNTTTPSSGGSTNNSGSSNSNSGGSNGGNTSVPAPSPAPAPAPPASGNAIVDEAQKHLGKAYVWGAKGPNTFDCSGFTRYVYLQVTGRDIGGWTVPQESSGTVISLSQLQPGDLVFWGSRGATHHVGIYIGGGQYVHAPTTGDVVKISSMTYYRPDFGVRVS